jgi:translation initiation factor 2B subunit (eIF-2B alpha/beta/delta family)
MLLELEAILHQLRADRLSGASALAAHACASLKAVCDRVPGRSLQHDLDEFALAVARAQPNMGSLWTLANGILHRSADASSVASFCEALVDHYPAAAARIAELAAGEVAGKRVLTTSSSSAVFHTMVRASGAPDTSVVVCESRPMREGVLMARELGHLNVNVTVVADAALSLFSHEAAVGLVGADAVNRDGVIGKIGMAHLAMACESRSIPLIVLADSTKFAPVPLSRDLRDPSELLDSASPGVTVENLYFEQVPFKHVDAIFSERGRMSVEDAQRAVWGAKVHPKLAQKF